MSSTQTHKDMAEQQHDRIVAAWTGGEKIAGISRSTGIRRQVIADLLEAHGVRDLTLDKKSVQRRERREEVLEYIRQHPGYTLADVAKTLRYDIRTLGSYINGTDEALLLIDPRTRPREYSRREMLDSILQVWQRLTEKERTKGLSRVKYDRMAPERAPSASLYERRFDGWSRACEEAGVHAAKPSRSNYRREFSDQDIIDAVAAYLQETRRTSYSGYSAWAREAPGRPSGSLVVARFGRWSLVRREVINQQRGAA